MPRFKVVITDFDYGDNDIERAILEPVGAEVVALQAKSEDDLVEAARDCDAMMNQYARVGAKTIAADAALPGDRPLRRRRRHRRRGGGDGARHPGHQCPRLLHRGGRRPRDRAVAGAGAQARRTTTAPRIRASGTGKSGQPVHRLRGQTMGIVSFGKIGQAIAERAKAFGVELIVYDPYHRRTQSLPRTAPSQRRKDELLARSDVMMMQVPMTAETRHFLGPARVRARCSRARSS